MAPHFNVAAETSSLIVSAGQVNFFVPVDSESEKAGEEAPGSNNVFVARATGGRKIVFMEA
jgi:hypothetical protein